MTRLFISLSAFLNLCAKQANRVAKKFKPDPNIPRRLGPISSLASSKQLLNKANPFAHKKRHINGKPEAEFLDEEGFGDGGLWQRSILMGEKCQPPEFSGVIYYDHTGNRLSELPPRSPRVSPLPGYALARVH
ncbi:hypothetical protein IFM89_000855 [Coptis chinensis]|uniref:Uncharacterized protein n=1 Tax=Coptis chinensis TaxID=261450 RepID=A0A835M3X7_9MAGN|nr:hypothetical protein IFM89_000855 [Coptis chinensis]